MVDLRYQTSHGPLTLDQIIALDVDPMFYVLASDKEDVHPKRRGTLQMDHPRRAKISANRTWTELTFNNGDTMVVPSEIYVKVSGKDWSGRQQVTSAMALELAEMASRWDVCYFSRVRRSGKYCQIRHSSMPTGERLWEHRFIYEHWYRESVDGFEVHHKDENPYNNCPENLEKLSRVDHARHTGRHQRTRHATKGLDGSFVKGGGPGRVATIPQEMPEYLKTTPVHQYLKVTAAKSLGQQSWKWLDLNFVDPDAAFVVNSMFFSSRKIE
jgi:hypothetical protein